ncbi:hypothetical protein BOX15_Mlig033230g3, partial [Macrostomum lignano]
PTVTQPSCTVAAASAIADMQTAHLTQEQTHEDLKAFERRLTEVMSHFQPSTRLWRYGWVLVLLMLIVSACMWLSDPLTYSSTSVCEQLARHPFFFLVLLVAVLLFAAGAHNRVATPSIMASRTRLVLAEYNMSCDDSGKLILKPRPAT